MSNGAIRISGPARFGQPIARSDRSVRRNFFRGSADCRRPVSASGTEIGIAPAYEILPGAFGLVCSRRTDAAARGLDYWLETTTNLVDGSWSTNGISIVGTRDGADGFEQVTNQIFSALMSAQVVRLRIGLDR